MNKFVMNGTCKIVWVLVCVKEACVLCKDVGHHIQPPIYLYPNTTIIPGQKMTTCKYLIA